MVVDSGDVEMNSVEEGADEDTGMEKPCCCGIKPNPVELAGREAESGCAFA